MKIINALKIHLSENIEKDTIVFCLDTLEYFIGQGNNIRIKQIGYLDPEDNFNFKQHWE
jgi:hypothetical protein